MIQTDLFSTHPEIQIHKFENNNFSQNLLNENRAHFSKQTKKVFELLQSGVILTQLGAAIHYKIHSLSRRACDILENGFDLKREMSKEKGVMTYFCSPAQIEFNKTKI